MGAELSSRQEWSHSLSFPMSIKAICASVLATLGSVGFTKQALLPVEQPSKLKVMIAKGHSRILMAAEQ